MAYGIRMKMLLKKLHSWCFGLYQCRSCVTIVQLAQIDYPGVEHSLYSHALFEDSRPTL